jgi:hypothetical protein
MTSSLSRSCLMLTRPLPLLLLLGSLTALPCVLTAATVTPFSGEPVSADSVVLSPGGVVVHDQHFALSDCDSLLLGAAQPLHDAGHSRLGVWLVDGSFLPAESLAADPKAPNAIVITGPLGEMSLPLAKILGWGPELLPSDDQGNDRVVVASGPLSGQVQGIADGQLKVLSPLSPDPLSLQVKDISSLRLAAALVKPSGIILSVVTDPDRPPLYLKPAAGLPLNCVTSIQLGEVASHLLLRVEGGRRSYLSALTPSQVSEEGAFGVVWHWKADTDLSGGPLRLGGVHYQHGVSVHSKCDLSWNLAGAYVRLHALLGISDLVAPEGDCAVSLLGDGKSLWSRASVKGSDHPLPIDLDLTGVTTLELKVEYGARYDIGDHLTLADAWLLKAH